MRSISFTRDSRDLTWEVAQKLLKFFFFLHVIFVLCVALRGPSVFGLRLSVTSVSSPSVTSLSSLIPRTAMEAISLIDWISDTLSQGYTNLQSLVECLDHRGIASDTAYSQARVC